MLPSAAEIFVGRDHELDMFRAMLEAVGRHRATVMLLSGEPGIGKTRLASEVGALAEQRGYHVLWGRCWEAGGAPAYWPWIEVIRSCIRGADPTELSKRLTAQAGHLALLVPELRERFPRIPEAELTTDPDRARFQLFDGMASFLRAVAEIQPLMVVLDDLHAADHSSVVMLQFLARQLRDVPLVLVGCFRDTEIRAGSETGVVLAETARDGHHVALRGLREHEVGHFISTLCPRAASPDLISTVRFVTGGNPFFVGELVRQLSSGNGLDGRVPLPDGIRDAVRSRLRRLSVDCIELLTLASVFGQDFGLPALAATASLPVDRVAATLEIAVEARLIAERAGALGHYVFFHGLIREVLYEDIAASRRAELHGLVGNTLERLHDADDDAPVATLAHHFFMASIHGDVEKAIVFCTRAADRALRQLAAPEAVEHYGRALQALSLTGGDSLRRRCALLLGRGRALERVGDFEVAREDFIQAATIARQIGDREAFANAAVGCGEQWALKFTCSIVDKSDLPLLEEALRVIPPERQSLRATLLARSGSALFYAGEHERGHEASVAAVALARSLGEPEVLARALSARHAVLLGPDGLQERFGVVGEIRRLADTTGNGEVRLRGHVLQLCDLVERGDVDEAELEIAKITRLIDEIGDPFEQWHCTMSRSAAALFRGRLATSESLAREAYDAAHRAPGQQRAELNAAQCFFLHLVVLYREQGRLDELPPKAWAIMEKFSSVAAWRVLAALVDLDLGHTQAAIDRFGHLGVRALDTIPRDAVWVGTMFLLAELCARLRDQARAQRVFELLAPHAEINATLASVVWFGGSTRALAILAGTLGRWDESVALFERAVEWHAEREALLWLGHTQIDYASILIERRASGDTRQASELLEAARSTADTLGAARLATRVGAVRQQLDPLLPPAVTVAARVANPARAAEAPLHAVFRREGEYWTVADGRSTARLQHSRGLTLIAFLLAQPGHEIHAAELVLVVNPPPPARLSRAALAGAARREVVERRLDPRARSAYRERLVALRLEIEEAESCNDPSRAVRAQAEIDLLTAELKRDLGMMGGRRSGSDAERARLNVTRAIRRALLRIEDAHPLLGEHFRRAIRTGTFCMYVPDPTSTIVWEA